jgi:sirohydrochlorin ferrochelatase
MNRIALIVSHGQPSDPEPAEAELAVLAARVAALLPGWDVRSATLAGARLAAVVQGGPGVVYPMFMAGGWFVQDHLPKRMAEAGGVGWHYLSPFGLDATVQELCVNMALEAGAGSEVLLAAHGSFRSAAPSEVAHAMAARLQAAGFARAEAYFIDQEPRIATARGFGAGSVCLPFFAARGGHVVEDLPGALAEAGFGGRVLEPLGLDPRVPGLIAGAISRVGANPPRPKSGGLAPTLRSG